MARKSHTPPDIDLEHWHRTMREAVHPEDWKKVKHPPIPEPHHESEPHEEEEHDDDNQPRPDQTSAEG